MTTRYNEYDLVGRKFGQLIVLNRDYTKSRKSWICKCECGNIVVIAQQELLRGDTISCGCYRKKLLTTHGCTGTHIYNIWNGIKNRCDLPSEAEYHRYGGRGIKVCDEWYVFETFKKWALENGYDSKLQIDRIDNNGNYEPSNCRWVTRKINCNNRNNNIRITWQNETKTIAEWARLYNIESNTLRGRLDRGWSIEKSLLTPVKIIPRERLLTYDNKTMNLKNWAKYLNIDTATLSERLEKWSLEQALSTPKKGNKYVSK